MRKLSIAFFLLLGNALIEAQEITQSISGQVIEKATQQPLPGAHVMVTSIDPPLSTTTDEKGNFKINQVPVGRISLTVSYIGYKPIQLNNIILNAGKELQLIIEMEEDVFIYDEVVVSSKRQKIRPSNEMALISARSFIVEETERYAGSRGDVARMASNFAGVAFANDQRNDIIIRGNSPTGLLWRLEDVEIPNPNHFAENGATGGAVSMLNNNVLRNSDFYTGAFPAEFGNALSGVFDLRMRNGNPSRHEYTIQSGFNGLELGAEGPISKNQGSSFLAYYRYSFLDLMDKLGFYFGTSGVPQYQDLIIKTNIPLKNGSIQAFTLAGKSQIAMLSSKIDSNDIYLNEGQNLYNHSMLGTAAIIYTHLINEKSYIKCIASTLYQSGGTNIDTLDLNNQNPFRVIEHNIDEVRASLATIYSYKHSANLTSKAGVQIDQMGYSLNSKSYSYDSLRLIPYLNQSKSLMDGPQLLRSYYQFNWKINPIYEITAGIHNLYFTLNRSISFEPRLSLAIHYNPSSTVNFGYGLHARSLPLSVYYLGTYSPQLGYVETNKNLDFIKANHWVLGYEKTFSDFLRLKIETYYQYLYNVPVSQTTWWYSILNAGASWGIFATDSMINKGKGKNYGIELTLERFLYKNFYFLTTVSLYRSYFTDLYGNWHHTAFDGNYIYNFLTGYEHPLNNQWTISFDGKLSTAGGKRYIPIDLQQSIQAGETRYDESSIFERKYAPFFKIDLKVAFRHNKARSTQEWQVYVENVTNHRNPLYEYYNSTRKKITRVYQLGIFPMVLWRLTF
ncbi:MAG TPA: carboxypeptidase-like regulatory domain-containing protein [Bacteroidales bacterium]|nr:carboxypeptidase-like regulatory domain-containing protein [Bacteroidales bacterium]HOK99711.1 carboxypeptidase-like regulatory domain-containing protein [Bacteroidales bacterium]